MYYKNVVVLRTNEYSSYWNEILSDLSPDIFPLIVKDSRVKNISFTDLSSVDFNFENISALELKVCNDMQWRFGDYVLYLADWYLEKNSISYDFIWVVEPDIFLNTSLDKIIHNMNYDQSDFCSTYFSTAKDDWIWSKYISEINMNKPYKTFFPFLRVSKNLVRNLYEARRKAPSLANDEVFVASYVGNKNISFTLFSNSLQYNLNAFSYGLPHYVPMIKLFNNSKYEIYHPAFFSFSLFIKNIIKKRAYKKILKRILLLDNED